MNRYYDTIHGSFILHPSYNTCSWTHLLLWLCSRQKISSAAQIEIVLKTTLVGLVMEATCGATRAFHSTLQDKDSVFITITLEIVKVNTAGTKVFHSVGKVIVLDENEYYSRRKNGGLERPWHSRILVRRYSYSHDTRNLLKDVIFDTSLGMLPEN